MAVPTGIEMYGPGASGHNSVTAQTALTTGSTADVYVYVHTATLPKVIMAFNYTAATTDDGFWSATMPVNDHFNWADGAYDGSDGLAAYIGPVTNTLNYIKDGVVTASTGATDGSDDICGFVGGGETVGGNSETLVYSCLGSISPGTNTDYNYTAG